MSRLLSQKYGTAFVSGASSGLGRAFTEMLLNEGVRVWGTARDLGRLTGFTPAERFIPVQMELGGGASAEKVFLRSAKDAGGMFDLVINNAGAGVFAPFAAAQFSRWEEQVALLLTNPARLGQAAIRGMRERGAGTLVNVTSLAVEFPIPCMSAYDAGKAGLAALSESLMIETRGTGLTVIDFRPGDYRTSFNQAMHTGTPEQPPSSFDPTTAVVWERLERNLATSPLPARAAKDLRAALSRGRSGVVRSGTFFQARLAPLFARCLPQVIRREIAARYFGAA